MVQNIIFWPVYSQLGSKSRPLLVRNFGPCTSQIVVYDPKLRYWYFRVGKKSALIAPTPIPHSIQGTDTSISISVRTSRTHSSCLRVCSCRSSFGLGWLVCLRSCLLHQALRSSLRQAWAALSSCVPRLLSCSAQPLPSLARLRTSRSLSSCLRACLCRSPFGLGWLVCLLSHVAHQAPRSSLRQAWAALFSCVPRLRFATCEPVCDSVIPCEPEDRFYGFNTCGQCLNNIK